MWYVSVAEASEKWGVSRRQVQRLLAEGRLPHARKYGRAWMIPVDAQKPADPRGAKPGLVNLSSDLSYVIGMIYPPAPRENPDSVLDAVNEPRLRLIHEGALAYARGDFKRAVCGYRGNAEDVAARLCACSIAIVAAMSMGDYPLYLEIEVFLQDIIRSNGGAVKAYAELVLASAYLGAMAPDMVPKWLKDGDFSALPPIMRFDAAYQRAKYYQCLGNYESMLAVAQTALSIGGMDRELSIPDMYLRLMCAIALYSLERRDEARRFLLDAMRLCLPHGFITPFAELMAPLGGLTEQCLRQEFPALYDAVVGQWKRTVPHWIEFHNHFTKGNITLILSLRDCEIALLAARGMPRAQIAKQFGISTGRLNNIMKEIYGKLFVSSREELAKFVL